MKSIVIVGGGFSGTVTAVNLVRLCLGPLRIVIVNKNQDPCRGIAYSTRNLSHLLNVAARNMSALADQPNHFVEWLGTRSEFLDLPLPGLREKFAPRRIYGDYLHNLFHWHAQTVAAEKKIQLEMMHDEVRDVIVEGRRATVTLAGGLTLMADKVVLAVGNQAPADFRLRGLNVQSPNYIGNPWIGWEQKLPARDQDLLLIGTGLTMVDTVLTLQDLGWQGRITAVSRHGLLPLPHFKGFDYPDPLAEENGPLSFAQAYAIFKKHYRAARARNLNPAIIVDKLRPNTQRLWQNFSLFDKKQFNRHLRTRWNVVRHRIAPEIHRQLTEAIARDRLEIVKGRLGECVEAGGTMRITVDSRGVKRVIEAGAVINCTGPQESYIPSKSGLFRQLLSRGTLVADEMNMGIRVAPDFSVRDSEGNSSEVLFAMGSLLKGTLWETSAVPELRSQCFRVAETLAGQLAGPAVEKSAIAEVVADVMEYSI